MFHKIEWICLYIYILVHDLVNVTALRIHVSPECRDMLEDLGGYNLESRGEVTMKVVLLKL